MFFLIFYSIPLISLALFIVSLCRYISAKKRNKVAPGTFSDDVIKERKIMLIAMSVILGILVAVFVGFIFLVFSAIAYM